MPIVFFILFFNIVYCQNCLVIVIVRLGQKQMCCKALALCVGCSSFGFAEALACLVIRSSVLFFALSLV